MIKAVCVFCSSSSAVDSAFFAAAEAVGKALAQRGYALVYGGSNIGLMGAVARSVQKQGGRVIGIIPEALNAKGIGHTGCDEFLVTRDLRQRKAAMEERADAFIALPGGFGTLEEMIEVLTLKQLGLHNKPLVFLNINGFYDPLIALFEHFYEQHFAKPTTRALYHVSADVSDLFTYLDHYQPAVIEQKWF